MGLLLSLLACWCEPPAESVAPARSPALGMSLLCPAEPRDLAASWLKPTGPGPFPTAVVLVGARTWDRWGDEPTAAWGHYRDIAQALVAGGAAVLVFDKGGTGATGGPTVDVAARTAEAHAAITCALAQPGADPTRLTLVGHSQGSVVATRAAIQGAPVQGLALLSPAVEVDALAALPDGLSITLVRGAIDGADVDDKRLQMLSARGLPARHVVVPSADHLLLDATERIPRAADPATAVHPVALRVIVDAVTAVGRSEP